MRTKWWIVSFLLLPLTGCGSDVVEQAKKAASDVTQSVTKSVGDAATSAQENLQLAGSSELTLDGPVKTAACYAVLTSGRDGQPGVLAIRSYKETEQESFPSLLVQADVTAEKLADLSGKSLTAQMFVKTAADRPTWCTALEQPIEIKVVTVTPGELKAEIVSGELATTDGVHKLKPQGKFTAVVP